MNTQHPKRFILTTSWRIKLGSHRTMCPRGEMHGLKIANKSIEARHENKTSCPSTVSVFEALFVRLSPFGREPLHVRRPNRIRVLAQATRAPIAELSIDIEGPELRAPVSSEWCVRGQALARAGSVQRLLSICLRARKSALLWRSLGDAPQAARII